MASGGSGSLRSLLQRVGEQAMQARIIYPVNIALPEGALLGTIWPVGSALSCMWVIIIHPAERNDYIFF